MNLTLSAELDSKKMNKFRRQFGESSNQALVRLGVDTAKMAAVLTQPEGKGKKKIIKSINSGANKNIAALPAKTFNYFANKRSPAFPFQGSWVRLDDSQILRSPGEIYDFVEKHRDNKGRVKSLSRGRRAICKQGDMDKAMTARRKLAGVAKGSWLGAGKSLARKSKGPEPASVGKNYMAWAQKHAKLGDSRFIKKILGKSEVHLISNAPSTKDKGLFSREAAKDAIEKATKTTMAFYRREVKRRLG